MAQVRLNITKEVCTVRAGTYTFDLVLDSGHVAATLGPSYLLCFCTPLTEQDAQEIARLLDAQQAQGV